MAVDTLLVAKLSKFRADLAISLGQATEQLVVHLKRFPNSTDKDWRHSARLRPIPLSL